MSVSRAVTAGCCLIACLKTAAADLDGLFRELDTDQDGLIVAGEVSEAQRPYFERALRVGDGNRDGKLELSELRTAAQDPLPQPAVQQNGRQVSSAAAAAGLRRFDRNADGKLSRAEIPPAIKERFEPLFERLGRDEVDLDQFLRTSRRQMSNLPAKEMTSSDSARTPGTQGGDFIAVLVRRLDRNGDGELAGREFEAAPEFLKFLDANNNNRISPDEVSVPDRTPSAMPVGGNDERPTTGRPALRTPAGLFSRFDQDKDGRIAIKDLPERLQNALRRADRNSDGQLTRQEISDASNRR